MASQAAGSGDVRLHRRSTAHLNSSVSQDEGRYRQFVISSLYIASYRSLDEPEVVDIWGADAASLHQKGADTAKEKARGKAERKE